MLKYNLSELKKRLGLKRSAKLRFALKNIVTHFAYRVGYFSSKDTIEIKKNLDKPWSEMQKLVLKPQAFAYIEKEYNIYKNLVPIKNFAKENDLYLSDVRDLAKDLRDNNSTIYNNFFVNTIFNAVDSYYLPKDKTKFFRKYYFSFLVASNQIQKSLVKTNNVAFASNSRMIEVSLLEQVQDSNSKKGRVLGFAKNFEGKTLPIVHFYNGNMCFVKELQHSPRSSGALNFKKIKLNTRVCIFKFELAELVSNRNQQKFNMFLRLLAGKNVSVKITIKRDLDYAENGHHIKGEVKIIMIPTYISVNNLDWMEHDPLNIKREKIKAYGAKGTISNLDLVDYLASHCDSETNTRISYLPNSDRIKISSTSYPQEFYFKNADQFLNLKRKADKAGQSLQEYIMFLAEISENSVQVAVFDQNNEDKKDIEENNFFARIGRKAVERRHLHYNKNRRSEAIRLVVKASQTKAGRDKLDHIFRDEPLLVSAIYEGFNSSSDEE